MKRDYPWLIHAFILVEQGTDGWTVDLPVGVDNWSGLEWICKDDNDASVLAKVSGFLV